MEGSRDSLSPLAWTRKFGAAPAGIECSSAAPPAVPNRPSLLNGSLVSCSQATEPSGMVNAGDGVQGSRFTASSCVLACGPQSCIEDELLSPDEPQPTRRQSPNTNGISPQPRAPWEAP